MTDKRKVDESNWTVLQGAIITGFSDLPDIDDPRFIKPHDPHKEPDSKPQNG